MKNAIDWLKTKCQAGNISYVMVAEKQVWIKNCNTPFPRYNRLTNRLCNRFDNRLYRVNKHPAGCQTGFQTGLTTGLTTVLNEQPLFVQRIVKSGVAVYTIQPVIKPVVKRVWQPVECLYTRYNRLSKRFDNRLYRVYKHLAGCQTGSTTGLTTGCIV